MVRRMSPVRAWILGAGICLPAAAASRQGEVYLLHGLLPGEKMGAAVAAVGDLDADGVPDVVGAGSNQAGGRIRVWSGLDGRLILDVPPGSGSPVTYTALATAGDVNADGVPDILAASSLHTSTVTGAMWAGAVWVYSGADGSEIFFFEGTKSSEAVGAGVAGGADLNGDGHADFAIGVPGRPRSDDLAGFYFVGGIDVRSGKDGSLLYEIKPDALGSGGGVPALLNDLDGDGIPDFVTLGSATVPSGPDGMLRWFSGQSGATLLTYYHLPGESFGGAVASTGDLDGDGLFDVSVGSPLEFTGSNCPGSVRAFSSADASELLYFANPGGPGCAPVGRSVAGLGDFDGDSVPDVAVGTDPPASKAYVLSGKTGQIVFQQAGEFESFFGFSVAGPGDLNGDGLGELAVGHAWSHPAGIAFAGSVHVYLAGCPAPLVYCAAKTNSQGCQTKVAWEGLLSLSIADNFVVRATDVVSQQLGMLLWSRDRAALPFQGGTLCLAAPLERLAPQSSGGDAVPDCSGVLPYPLGHDLAAEQGWTAGDDLYAQFWYRDPAHPDGTATGLSDAVRFHVCH